MRRNVGAHHRGYVRMHVTELPVRVQRPAVVQDQILLRRSRLSGYRTAGGLHQESDRIEQIRPVGPAGAQAPAHRMVLEVLKGVRDPGRR